jgi:hypothetical protein
MAYIRFPRQKQPLFNNFLQFSKNQLNVYAAYRPHFSGQTNLHPGSDCALVYNPQGSMKYPKLVLHIPSLYESGGDDSPHFVMMAVIAKMILDKDQDFDSLISKKISEYVYSFETANRSLGTD